MNRAFAALEVTPQDAVRRDLEHRWMRWNQAKDGSARYESEHLEVITVRKSVLD
jgi:hypothetical protein